MYNFYFDISGGGHSKTRYRQYFHRVALRPQAKAPVR